jgi:hypothetical protein
MTKWPYQNLHNYKESAVTEILFCVSDTNGLTKRWKFSNNVLIQILFFVLDTNYLINRETFLKKLQ